LEALTAKAVGAKEQGNKIGQALSLGNSKNEKWVRMYHICVRFIPICGTQIVLQYLSTLALANANER